MQSKQQFFLRNLLISPADQAGGQTLNAPMPAIFGGTVLPPGLIPLRPFHGVEFQPSEACPRNFIVFDQTDNRSQIMFHPAIGIKFGYAGSSAGVHPSGDNAEKRYINNEQRESTSCLKEDSDDIDALLSFGDEEYDESDEEELSTARTDVNNGCNSPDSCSNYESPPRKIRVTSLKKASSGGGRSCRDKKHKKMIKMVNALRGIVPGANRMSTVAVLDEAVRYLKSLKVEVQKLGVGKLNGCT